MPRLRFTLGSILLLMTTAPAFGQRSLPAPVSVRTADESPSCDSNSLPSDIQDRLRENFGLWKIQEQSNLSTQALKTWTGRKPRGCPGIAVGLFHGGAAPSYAVLIVLMDRPDAGYKFLVFNRASGTPSYLMTMVEQSDNHGASNFFITTVLTSRFFSEESKRKFQVQTTEGILMVDSADEEYEADVFFWSNGRFRQEPVDD